jgi:1,4-dihydroxy-2-naphthoyl-CoA synthase
VSSSSNFCGSGIRRPDSRLREARLREDGAAYDPGPDRFYSFEAGENDPTIRVITLTGTGDTFTSGNDMKDLQQRSAEQNSSAASPFLDALPRLQKPPIAAVNGAAIGIGTPMLAHCDLIVAARKAWPGARGR